MKKKDQNEPDSKRRRKSTRTESHDRDVENNTPSAKAVRPADEKTLSSSSAKKSPKSALAKVDVTKPRDLSEISVIQIEEKEAEERLSGKDVETYKKTCSEIQRLVSEANDLKCKGEQHNSSEIIERRIQATLLTTSLKKLNRLSLIRGKKAKEKTQDLKQKVDVLHLDLQNLLYEVMHMKKEIRKCTEFTSKDEDIDLVDVDTFYEEAPADISKPDLTKSDSHHQMLARLDWELQQRKKLASMKDQLGKTKEDMEKEILQKKDTLESLQPSLQEILKATLPVQEKMDLNIDTKKAQYETALFLPKPLYVFYVQACAYRDSTDHHIAINIEGDVQSAKAWFDRENLDAGEYDESDAEDNNEAGDKEENKRRKHRKDKEKSRLEEQRRSLLRQHPLTVYVKITWKGILGISIQFSYLPALHIVTITTSVEFSAENSAPVLTSSSLFASDSVLRNLFDGDDGNSSPNPSNQYQLKKLGLEDFSSYIHRIGRPYHWVQRVCGLHYLPNAVAQHLSADANLSSHNIESVIKRIKERISARLSLQKQLASLETLMLPLVKNTTNLFPANILTSLTAWKCITYSDFAILDHTSQLVEAGFVDESDRFYMATFRREKETIEAAIVIGVDYPCQPPLFALNYISSKQNNAAVNGVREIECDLNTNFTEFTEENPEMLLSILLKRLMICFDVFCETGDTQLKQERLFIKTRRGRDRSRPLHYLPTKGFFVHR